MISKTQHAQLLANQLFGGWRIAWKSGMIWKPIPTHGKYALLCLCSSKTGSVHDTCTGLVTVDGWCGIMTAASNSTANIWRCDFWHRAELVWVMNLKSMRNNRRSITQSRHRRNSTAEEAMALRTSEVFPKSRSRLVMVGQAGCKHIHNQRTRQRIPTGCHFSSPFHASRLQNVLSRRIRISFPFQVSAVGLSPNISDFTNSPVAL